MNFFAKVVRIIELANNNALNTHTKNHVNPHHPHTKKQVDVSFRYTHF